MIQRDRWSTQWETITLQHMSTVDTLILKRKPRFVERKKTGGHPFKSYCWNTKPLSKEKLQLTFEGPLLHWGKLIKSREVAFVTVDRLSKIFENVKFRHTHFEQLMWTQFFGYPINVLLLSTAKKWNTTWWHGQMEIYWIEIEIKRHVTHSQKEISS